MERAELSQFRSEAGLSQKALANLLNTALDMHYSSTTISQWETGKKPIPGHIEDAVRLLANDGAIDALTNAQVAADDAPTRPVDSAPRFDASASVFEVPSPVHRGTALEAACVEMFRGIGMMLEMTGMVYGDKVLTDRATGQQMSLVQMDGKIVTEDAETLGRAWAKLAEQNAWVARIITSMTTGGAWVEVLMATSGTVYKVYSNHAQYAAWASEQSAVANGATATETEPDPITL